LFFTTMTSSPAELARIALRSFERSTLKWMFSIVTPLAVTSKRAGRPVTVPVKFTSGWGDPTPSSVALLLTTTCSLYVPWRSLMVLPETRLTPSWILPVVPVWEAAATQRVE
jgi:hypothetical protein